MVENRARCIGRMGLKLRNCYLHHRKRHVFGGVTLYITLISAFEIWELTVRLYGLNNVINRKINDLMLSECRRFKVVLLVEAPKNFGADATI